MTIKISSYFKINTDISLNNATKLTINDKDIKFFFEPLLDKSLNGKSELYRLNTNGNEKAGDREAILLKFFVGYRPISILILSLSIPEVVDKDELDKVYKKLWKSALLICKDKKYLTELRRYSCLVEDDITQEPIIQFAKDFLGDRKLEELIHQLTCTEKGFLFYIIEPYHKTQYERYLLMYALLMAYQIVFEMFINELSSFASADNFDFLDRLRKECAQFNAIFYFNNPIKPGNSNLRPTWNVLAEPFNMEALAEEVMDQLEAVAQIYQLEREAHDKEKEKLERQEKEMHEREMREREKEEQKRQAVLSFWLSVFGILLAALTIVEVTPSELTNFMHEWGNVLFGRFTD